MLHLTSESNIWLAVEPVDFRKQIDGLVALCKNYFNKQPSSGDLFIFMNRARTMVRILCYEQHGYWLATKRLSRGRYSLWSNQETEMHSLAAHELKEILKTFVASRTKRV